MIHLVNFADEKFKVRQVESSSKALNMGGGG